MQPPLPRYTLGAGPLISHDDLPFRLAKNSFFNYHYVLATCCQAESFFASLLYTNGLPSPCITLYRLVVVDVVQLWIHLGAGICLKVFVCIHSLWSV